MPAEQPEPRDAVESAVLEALEEGDLQRAATELLRGYGAEILRFVGAMHRDGDEAADVFSAFTEAMWHALPSFERRSSLRTWAYAIARRCSLQHRRSARRRNARFEALPEVTALLDVEAQIRTATLTFLRTERRSKLAAIRDALPEDDRVLLMLRVDKKLPWTDVALVLAGEDAPELSAEELKREGARLRKRFQVLKEKLREIGLREGLLTSPAE